MDSSDHPADVTRMLHDAAAGDSRAAADLLPIIYHELRSLARARLAQTPPGNTLQPTALVHEAYLRLVGGGDPGWQSRTHFFIAAARAMRDILVEQARQKATLKRGGDRRLNQVPLSGVAAPADDALDDVLALNDAVKVLEADDARKGEIVMLRYFAGLSQAETAAALAVSERTIEREWLYIKAYLRRALGATPTGEPGHEG